MSRFSNLAYIYMIFALCEPCGTCSSVGHASMRTKFQRDHHSGAKKNSSTARFNDSVVSASLCNASKNGGWVGTDKEEDGGGEQSTSQCTHKIYSNPSDGEDPCSSISRESRETGRWIEVRMETGLMSGYMEHEECESYWYEFMSPTQGRDFFMCKEGGEAGECQAKGGGLFNVQRSACPRGTPDVPYGFASMDLVAGGKRGSDGHYDTLLENHYDSYKDAKWEKVKLFLTQLASYSKTPADKFMSVLYLTSSTWREGLGVGPIAAEANQKLANWAKPFRGAVLLDFPTDDAVQTILGSNPTRTDKAPSNKSLLHEWMRHIPDDTTISKLALPGTHESTAILSKLIGKDLNTTDADIKKRAGGGDAMIICQTNTILQQLMMGIRWLDIRLGYVTYKGGTSLYACHAGYVFDMQFAAILEEIAGFLAENPTETVFINLKNEMNSGAKRLVSNFAWSAGTSVEAMGGAKFVQELVGTFEKFQKTHPTVLGDCHKPKRECQVLFTHNIGDYRGKIIVVNNDWNAYNVEWSRAMKLSYLNPTTE